MDQPAVVDCSECGARNELPEEALTVGRYRCHGCGAVNPVPDYLRLRQETPGLHEEPVQTITNYAPSAYNTPEALRQAEIEAAKFGCLLPVLLGIALLMLLG